MKLQERTAKYIDNCITYWVFGSLPPIGKVQTEIAKFFISLKRDGEVEDYQIGNSPLGLRLNFELDNVVYRRKLSLVGTTSSNKPIYHYEELNDLPGSDFIDPVKAYDRAMKGI